MVGQGRTRNVVAVVVGLVGLVFIAQGLGVPIARSPMIGDLRWAVIGLVVVLAAAVYAARGMRRPR